MKVSFDPGSFLAKQRSMSSQRPNVEEGEEVTVEDGMRYQIDAKDAVFFPGGQKLKLNRNMSLATVRLQH